MAYLGRSPQVGNYDKLDSIAGSFNGALQTFAMTVGAAAFTAQSARTLLITVDGVLQEPDVAYTVAGTNITFTAPPTTGATFFGIALGDTLDIGIPGSDTVDTKHLKNNAVTAAKIEDDAVTTAKIEDDAVTAAKILSFFGSLGGTVNGYDNIVNRIMLKDYGVVEQSVSPSAGNTTVDLTQGNAFKSTSTVATQWVFSNPAASGNLCGFTLILTAGASYASTWPTSVKWPNGTAPTLGALDTLEFWTNDAGTNWYGAQVGAGFAVP